MGVLELLTGVVAFAQTCDSPKKADQLVRLLANTDIKTIRKSYAKTADDVAKKTNKWCEKRVQCNVCGKKISNKYNLRTHIRNKHENDKQMNPPNNEESNSNARNGKRTREAPANNSRKASQVDAVPKKKRAVNVRYQKSTQLKEIENTKMVPDEEYKCAFCKVIFEDENVREHYKTHNIVDVEEILFDSGHVLVYSDRDTICGKADWFKTERENAEKRYKEGCCKLCKTGVDLSDRLELHYKDIHNVDADCLKAINHLFRASTKAHLPKIVTNKMSLENSNRSYTCGDVSEEKASEKVYNNKEKSGVESDAADKSRYTKGASLFIYVCKCGLATEKYNSVVEHSQRHLAMPYKPVVEICGKCEFKFEAPCFANHVVLHENGHSRDDFKVVAYDYEKLLSSAWLDTFKDLPPKQRDEVSSSIYKYTRTVKFHSNSMTGPLVYQCDMCHLCINSEKVENHLKTCAKTKNNADHNCSDCGLSFESNEDLIKHKNNNELKMKIQGIPKGSPKVMPACYEKNRLVTFNKNGDIRFNEALQKNEYSQRSIADFQSKPINTFESNSLIIIEVIKKITQFCEKCNRLVAEIDMDTHRNALDVLRNSKILQNAPDTNVAPSIQNTITNKSVTNTSGDAGNINDDVQSPELLVAQIHNDKGRETPIVAEESHSTQDVLSILQNDDSVQNE